MSKKTPVAFFTFNRPEHTKKVLKVIRDWQPETLLLVNDGPREEHPKECEEVRSILNEIDWPCDVRRNYADENLGCRNRMISGISWVFSEVEESIILEDDCLPSLSFFDYASEMLTRYRNNSQIMMVSGSNLVMSNMQYEHSYTFCRSVGIWGWGTWARAWSKYDKDISDWPQLRETDWLLTVLQNLDQVRYWKQKFDSVYAGHSTWDYQWLYAVWSKFGLSIVPSKNLIKNIGFDGPRYDDPPSWIRNIIRMEADDLVFPLNHPLRIEIDRDTDKRLFIDAYSPQNKSFNEPDSSPRIVVRIYHKILRLTNRFLGTCFRTKE